MSEAAAHALIARVLGLTVDPADLLEAVEADAELRRSILDLVPVSTIAGFRGGSLERIVSERVAIAPRQDASLAWLEGVRARASDSVWATGGCQSWYLDKTGTPTLDPSTLSELEAQLAAVNWDDFVVSPLATSAAKAA